MQLEDLQNEPLDENSLLFVNWHSLTKQNKNGDWLNKYMREREDGLKLENILNQTRAEGKKIILIVDEAHQYSDAERSQSVVTDIFKPILKIELSATPSNIVSQSFNQRFIEVKRECVIDSGLIRESCILNPSIGDHHIDQSSVNETVLRAAIDKRQQLVDMYQQLKLDINPLILIQLPSDNKNKLSKLDQSILEATQEQLRNYNITYDNKKLALWLADAKNNLENIVNLDSNVEVLIFKQAVATGWDCPRAQIFGYA